MVFDIRSCLMDSGVIHTEIHQLPGWKKLTRACKCKWKWIFCFSLLYMICFTYLQVRTCLLWAHSVALQTEISTQRMYPFVSIVHNFLVLDWSGYCMVEQSRLEMQNSSPGPLLYHELHLRSFRVGLCLGLCGSTMQWIRWPCALKISSITPEFEIMLSYPKLRNEIACACHSSGKPRTSVSTGISFFVQNES